MKAKRLVYGVATNDADYQVSTERVVDGRRKTVWRCPFYRAWMGMLERSCCQKYKARFPTYSDVTVCSEWLLFSKFRVWMQAQDWTGKQLDKDLLIPGNKTYSPEFCVFITGRINMFLADAGAIRGRMPVGVDIHKATGRFRARCRNPLKTEMEFLGHYGSAEEAHEAWRKRKHELACQYADDESDPRIAAALRSRYARKDKYHE